MTAFPDPPLRLMVIGSRNWRDEALVKSQMSSLHEELGHPEHVVVMTGGCETGSDAMAERFARARGWSVEKYPADWKRFHSAAVSLRNRLMVKSDPDYCLAFILNGSSGASGACRAALRADVPTRQVLINDSKKHDRIFW